MTRTLTLAFAFGLCISAAAAQPAPETFKFIPAKDIAALTAHTTAGPKTAHLGEHPGYDVEYAARTDSGNLVEVHAHTTHYIHILEGEGTLTYGGTLTGAKETGPGETRGGVIAGGTAVPLHPGDYMQIPATLPHMFNAAPGQTLRYLVFNIKG